MKIINKLMNKDLFKGSRETQRTMHKAKSGKQLENWKYLFLTFEKLGKWPIELYMNSKKYKWSIMFKQKYLYCKIKMANKKLIYFKGWGSQKNRI